MSSSPAADNGDAGRHQLPDNPFRALRVRTMLPWLIVAAPAALVLSALLAVVLGLDRRDTAVLSIAFDVWLYGSIAIWLLWQFSRRRLDLRRFLGRLPKGYRWLPTIGILVPAVLFSMGTLIITLYLISLAAPGLVESYLAEDVFSDSSGSEVPKLYTAWLLLSLLVLAPVVEEFLFRGILVNRWTTKWGIGKSVVVSSLLFGLPHGLGVVGATLFGVVLALLYVRTRTLIVPIACHMANNLFVAVISLGGAGSPPDSAYSVEQLQTDAWVGALLLALSAPWLAHFAHRNWPSRNTPAPYFAWVARDVPEL